MDLTEYEHMMKVYSYISSSRSNSLEREKRLAEIGEEDSSKLWDFYAGLCSGRIKKPETINKESEVNTMRYKMFMKKIFQQLTEYKSVVDNLSALYQAEKNQFEEELSQMQDKYTTSYIRQCRQSWTPKTDYSSKIKEAREKCQSAATKYFDKIEEEINTYFQIPVDSGFSSTIMAIKNLEIVPNNKEIELLQGAAKGYWNQRILHEIGTSRTKKEPRAVIEDGKSKIVKEDVKVPFAIGLPDIQKTYDALQAVKNSITVAFQSYCGIDYALRDVVFPPSKIVEQTSEALEKEYKLEVEPPKPDALAISKMASSARCFNADHLPYVAFFEVMEDLATSMPEAERKTTLTDSDKELINTLIDDNYRFSAERKAVEISRINEDLKQLLLLDDRYSPAIQRELGGEYDE